MNDPFKILGVDSQTDLLTIKKKYKSLALKLHPDRGGNETLFKLLQLSYAKILEEHKLRRIDKEFNELKLDFQTFSSDQERKTNKPDKTEDITEDSTKSSFHDHFNNVFQTNKTKTAYDEGYAHEMLKSNAIREDINIDKTVNKFTADSFNKAFAKSNSENVKHLIKREVPQPHMVGKQLQFTELGVDTVDDFSGENTSKRDLHYTDYKIAHSTTKLIDPNLVKNRKTFKNVKDIERHRSTISEYTDTELKAYEEYKHTELLKETSRHKKQQQMDESLNTHFEKVNQLMMTHKV